MQYQNREKNIRVSLSFFFILISNSKKVFYFFLFVRYHTTKNSVAWYHGKEGWKRAKEDAVERTGRRE